MEKICRTEGCQKKSHARGLCMACYHKDKRKKESARLSYECMIRRCYEPSNNRYYRYGARNIKVCDRWLESYENFIEDMGEKPFQGAHIDRRDGNLDYTPENCKWSSPTENNRHKKGVKLSIDKARAIRTSVGVKPSFLAKIYDVCPQTIRKVLNNEIWREDVV